MALSQQALSIQMLAQLRMLDPSVSAEVGTPERKILDTVAQALSDAQVDLTQLAGALDIDSKMGGQLDRFLALFGFGRQTAVAATGYVTFSRTSPSTTDIHIPSRTQLIAPGINAIINAPNEIVADVVFQTLYDATLPFNQTSVTVPVSAVTAGAVANVGAGRITSFAATPIYGVHEITNETPMTGGVDAEDDDELKTRFKNTVFRNLAGTQDQFLALAASTKYTTKANVVGPISRYREYLQVPQDDDAASYDVNPEGGVLESGNDPYGDGRFTTALSTIPYSKHTYTEVPNFVSNGQIGAGLVFYREDVDWILNTKAQDKDKGDAHRLYTAVPSLGDNPRADDFRPNVTFLNVYEGDNDGVVALRKGDTVLFEHAYMSTASRNDWDRNVMNCVDLFIDGSNDTAASSIIAAPGASTAFALVNDPASKYHYANFRLVGEPDIAPATWLAGTTDGVSNGAPAPGGAFVGGAYLYLPLFWQPVTGLPAQIQLLEQGNDAIFLLGTHYWLVEDVTELHGTVRARNGIVWDRTKRGLPSAAGTQTGKSLAEFVDTDQAIEIAGYSYDRNVVDLQASVEANKQVTTDILVHRARRRYFKLDITVMYSRGANAVETNNSIRLALDNFLRGLSFGTVVQLSDLLRVVHTVANVDNVRWTSDIPGAADKGRVQETNRAGRPRGDDYIYSSDFFLMDDELPQLAEAIHPDDLADQGARRLVTLPGVIIRSRAQNTWTRA